MHLDEKLQNANLEENGMCIMSSDFSSGLLTQNEHNALKWIQNHQATFGFCYFTYGSQITIRVGEQQHLLTNNSSVRHLRFEIENCINPKWGYQSISKLQLGVKPELNVQIKSIRVRIKRYIAGDLLGSGSGGLLQIRENGERRKAPAAPTTTSGCGWRLCLRRIRLGFFCDLLILLLQ